MELVPLIKETRELALSLLCKDTRQQSASQEEGSGLGLLSLQNCEK